MSSVQFYKDNSKNQNTTKATNAWFRNFTKWAESSGRERNIETLDKKELNDLLEIYFAEIKRQDGKQYEPTSLANMQAGIDRYLKEAGCIFSILKDIEFKGSRDVLEGKAKYLREELGMGKLPNAAESLSNAEEKLLWDSGQMGTNNGQIITNTVWFLLTEHFGLRGRQEHHSMCVEDFVFKLDDYGNQFITYAEGVTKTRGGGLRKKKRKVTPKMFETRDVNKCPVMIFELFLSKRPADMRNSGPLYLAIIPKPTTNVWFKSSRLGENSIDKIMKEMVKASPLETSKKLTNHSARKTTVRKLRAGGASRSEIIEITGHSNEGGLDPYDSGDEVQQRRMSHVIDQVTPLPSTSTAPMRSNGARSLTRSEIPPKSFSFFSEDEYKRIGEGSNSINYKFYNCNVTIGEQKQPEKKEVQRKRVRLICSSDSSQE